MSVLGSEPLSAAVIFSDRQAAVGLRDRTRSWRQVAGKGFEATLGRIADQRIAVAVPTTEPVDFPRLVAAMRDAHQPRLMIGAGFSTPVPLVSTAPPTGSIGTKVVASRVVGPSGAAYRFADAGGAADLPTGEFFDAAAAPPSGDGVVNGWSLPFAAACAKLEQPAAVVTVVTDHAAPDESAEAANYWRQRSTAARAGALLRGLWRRPSLAKELMRRQSQTWHDQEALANAIESLLGSLARQQTKRPHA